MAQRKAREIASIGYGQPTNIIKRADGSEVRFLHGDPLIISLHIGTMDVKRVLCDGGSNIYVMFTTTFKGMKLKESKLTLVLTATYRFGPEALLVLGSIKLPVMFVRTGTHNEPHFTRMMVKWVVVMCIQLTMLSSKGQPKPQFTCVPTSNT